MLISASKAEAFQFFQTGNVQGCFLVAYQQAPIQDTVEALREQFEVYQKMDNGPDDRNPEPGKIAVVRNGQTTTLEYSGSPDRFHSSSVIASGASRRYLEVEVTPDKAMVYDIRGHRDDEANDVESLVLNRQFPEMSYLLTR